MQPVQRDDRDFAPRVANFIWPLVVVTTRDMYTTELGLATYHYNRTSRLTTAALHGLHTS